MSHEVEISSIDLRYAGHRMRNRAQEGKFLARIQERGIEEPLLGVELKGTPVLLDGFKRYRCAQRLGMGQVPFSSLAADEATAVLVLLRTSNRSGLGILEQARFVDDLRRVHGMGLAEIATALSRSKSWVHMRLGLIGEMAPAVRQRILEGAFPAYAYMSSVRPFMRMDEAGVASFVGAVSGRGLSVREIGDLVQGYFRGPPWFREAVEEGHLALPLAHLREAGGAAGDLGPGEGRLLRDLEGLLGLLGRVVAQGQDARPLTPAFRAQAHLLLTQILARWGAVRPKLEEFHDRTAEV